MAKKITASSKNGSAKKAAAAVTPEPVTVTPVRHSAPPPKPAAVATRLAPSHEQIALSAYLIWRSGTGGSQDDNWFRAERELRSV